MRFVIVSFLTFVSNFLITSIMCDVTRKHGRKPKWHRAVYLATAGLFCQIQLQANKSTDICHLVKKHTNLPLSFSG